MGIYGHVCYYILSKTIYRPNARTCTQNIAIGHIEIKPFYLSPSTFHLRSVTYYYLGHLSPRSPVTYLTYLLPHTCYLRSSTVARIAFRYRANMPADRHCLAPRTILQLDIVAWADTQLTVAAIHPARTSRYARSAAV